MHPADSIYQRRYTVEEYFALEEQSDVRHEYYHGEISPVDGFDAPENMAGGTKAHNRLIQNCTFALRLGLRGRGCEIFAENVRLAVENDTYYNYPDVVVSCEPADDDPRTVHHPVLMIEVLSKSTEARDRGWKFEQYWQLPSLQQYVLIAQNRVLVDSFTRTAPDAWKMLSHHQLTDTLQIPALGLSLPVADLYENLSLPPLRLADV